MRLLSLFNALVALALITDAGFLDFFEAHPKGVSKETVHPSTARLSEIVKKKIDSSIDTHMEDMLSKATSPTCRAKVTAAFADFILSEVEEHGPWMGRKSRQVAHKFKNSCPASKPKASVLRKPMKDIQIFFFMMLHRYPKMIKRQIDALQHPNHYFAVHLDGKADPSKMIELQEQLIGYDNVEILQVGPL
jgi:hypothetical protein